ncbi:MAG: hypothetical protein BEN19_08925 [Epulopiscium sp. Nuni2H_MBin003]|nr:MAG: hypothetical protein BEN19_08925 [Epulopiscium sp. Nuni2H_MBin003]
MQVSVNKSNGTILDELRKMDVHMNAPCNGNGTCGKCKVKILGNAPVPTDLELKSMEQAILDEGYRLACKVKCDTDFTIEMDSEKDKFSIVADYAEFKEDLVLDSTDGLGIAIDIGTTTIALMLVDLQTGETLKTHTLLNSQRRYGSDVISRIDYANNNGVEELQNHIKADLITGIKKLAPAVDVISKVVIAANTTMLHLLTGANCKGLGVYPFTAEFLDTQTGKLSELFGDEFSGTYTLLAGVSTYVGADIVSGMLMTNMYNQDAISLLVDIGTNGEMAIGNKDGILCLATAAGPAFEGGNISCGIGSIEGAICKVFDNKGTFTVNTIEDKEAAGICGSGLIDAIACALKQGMIDETGYVETDDDKIHLTDKISLNQKDIREFQLAKSAIRAGVEVLLIKHGVKAGDIENVYLAGGFGQFINLDNAFDIGLLPKEFVGKVQRVGNISAGGAKKYLVYKDQQASVEKITEIAVDLNLAHDPIFNEFFATHMLFEEEE